MYIRPSNFPLVEDDRLPEPAPELSQRREARNRPSRMKNDKRALKNFGTYLETALEPLAPYSLEHVVKSLLFGNRVRAPSIGTSNHLETGPQRALQSNSTENRDISQEIKLGLLGIKD